MYFIHFLVQFVWLWTWEEQVPPPKKSFEKLVLILGSHYWCFYVSLLFPFFFFLNFMERKYAYCICSIDLMVVVNCKDVSKLTRLLSFNFMGLFVLLLSFLYLAYCVFITYFSSLLFVLLWSLLCLAIIFSLPIFQLFVLSPPY